MNFFSLAYCRTYQAIYRILMKIVKIREPKLIEGEGSSNNAFLILEEHRIKKVLIITGENIYYSGLMKSMVDELSEHDISFTIFKDVIPNPTIDLIEAAYQTFKRNNCEAIIAFGGGSPMDTAKAVGARISCPNKSIPMMKGNIKIRKKLPLLIAIPTTAGTGSEATLAAVVSNPKTREKYALQDPVLVPSYAILDPLLIKDLPGKITSTTGMDALTHALEAFIGKSNTRLTKKASIEAIKLIMDNLELSYDEPHNLKARSNMLKASYLAGVAFTRAYVGNVHAIAHTLGGFYNVPHGLANAIILPIVLRYYGKYVYNKLAKIVDLVFLDNKLSSKEEKAIYLIDKIELMNKHMHIENTFGKAIKKEDLPLMIKRAKAEANPLYPVPKQFSTKDFLAIYKTLMQ